MEEQTKVKTQKVPPDGGWGWAIVAAFVLYYSILLPTFINFGIIYKEKIDSIGLPATDVAIIINVNVALGSVMGLVAVPFIRNYGCRKVAVVAGILFVAGLFLTIFATSFFKFFVFYGIITAFGFGLGAPTFFVSLIAYFLKHRNKVSGLAMTLTAIGNIGFPPLITFLLDYYGGDGCILIISALSLHLILAALLLQPVEWHMIDAVADDQVEGGETLLPSASTNESVEKKIPDNLHERRLTISTDNIDKLGTIFVHNQMDPELLKRKKSLQYINAHNENLLGMKKGDALHEEQTDRDSLRSNTRTNSQKNWWRAAIWWTIDTFDLTLLKDKIFINVTLGLSLCDFSEINFIMITPFILMDLNYTNIEIAGFQSTVATSDIVFRFLSPFIGDYFNQPPRVMFMYSFIIFTIFRTGLLAAPSYLWLLGVGVFLGLAKGLAYVYWNVVLPSVVPIERLAAASGIQMFANGILMLCAGPLIGYFRDVTGNYWLSVMVLHSTTVLALVLWVGEFIYFKIKNKNRRNQ